MSLLLRLTRELNKLCLNSRWRDKFATSKATFDGLTPGFALKSKVCINSLGVQYLRYENTQAELWTSDDSLNSRRASRADLFQEWVLLFIRCL